MIDDESTVLVVERKMDPSHLRRCSMIADFDMRCPVVCCAVVVEVAVGPDLVRAVVAPREDDEVGEVHFEVEVGIARTRAGTTS